MWDSDWRKHGWMFWRLIVGDLKTKRCSGDRLEETWKDAGDRLKETWKDVLETNLRRQEKVH